MRESRRADGMGGAGMGEGGFGSRGWFIHTLFTAFGAAGVDQQTLTYSTRGDRTPMPNNAHRGKIGFVSLARVTSYVLSTRGRLGDPTGRPVSIVA